MTQDEQQKAKQGIILAVAAYTMWGVAPIYFKALGNVSPLEILSHRVFWSFFLLAILLHVGRRWRSVRDVFKTPKKLYLTRHKDIGRAGICAHDPFVMVNPCIRPHTMSCPA